MFSEEISGSFEQQTNTLHSQSCLNTYEHKSRPAGAAPDACQPAPGAAEMAPPARPEARLNCARSGPVPEPAAPPRSAGRMGSAGPGQPRPAEFPQYIPPTLPNKAGPGPSSYETGPGWAQVFANVFAKAEERFLEALASGATPPPAAIHSHRPSPSLSLSPCPFLPVPSSLPSSPSLPLGAPHRGAAGSLDAIIRYQQ